MPRPYTNHDPMEEAERIYASYTRAYNGNDIARERSYRRARQLATLGWETHETSRDEFLSADNRRIILGYIQNAKNDVQRQDRGDNSSLRAQHESADRYVTRGNAHYQVHQEAYHQAAKELAAAAGVELQLSGQSPQVELPEHKPDQSSAA